MKKPLILLSPTAILGYGFPEASFFRGLSFNPHLIAVDAGSSDPGPYYLGSGEPFVSRGAVKRDLSYLLQAALSRKIPLLIGTAGGSGAKPHLQWCREIMLEVAREEGLSFRLAVIPADIPKDFLLRQVAAGKVEPLGPVPELTAAAVEETTYLVGQMGVEPLIAALEGGADVILAGRSYDPVLFAALPIKEGYPAGLALHLGKILECAAIAALPGSGSDAMLGFLEKDQFMVEPASPKRRATVESVAAHTLYEKGDPYRLPGPGGLLDLHESSFEQSTERRVAVKGSRFLPASTYTVKLEGAKLIGHRVITVAGARDPHFIASLDSITQGVKERTVDNFAAEANRFQLNFHIYGRDGVMGQQEPQPRAAHEVGIVIEAVADNPELAAVVLGFARSTMLHYGFPGRLSTAGNLAFPYSPSDFKVGGAYAFSVYHLLKVEDPEKLFPITYEEVR